MGSYFSKEAIIALLKTLFVNWWKSQGKTLAADEWIKINDLINEKIAGVVGPRKGMLISDDNGVFWRVMVDDTGTIYSRKKLLNKETLQ